MKCVNLQVTGRKNPVCLFIEGIDFISFFFSAILLEYRDFYSLQEQIFFSSPSHLDLSGTHSASYPMGNGGALSPVVKRVSVVNLTSHVHLMPRLRMRGAIPPLANTSSWRQN
jgi:hypothetical protein